jgi:hypothetical protein
MQKPCNLAKGPTAAEFFKDVLLPVLAAAKDKLSKKLEAGVKPQVSFDNDQIHVTALEKHEEELKQKCRWNASTMRCPLSPYSPDMHRVIEHTHGMATLKFRQWLYNNPKAYDVHQYKKAFEQIYRECCTAAVISKDVAGLPEVYKAIIAERGGWPHRQFR